MDKKLPKFLDTTITGITAAELLTSVLDRFSIVIPVPQEKDIGIDMRAELLKNNYPMGIHYNVQCKGTEEVDDEVDKLSVSIKVSTINYWLQQKEPTFLVVVDKKAELFYWSYPYMQIKDRIEEIQSKDTVSIHVFKSSFFNTKLDNLPKQMMDYIREYHVNILEKIALVLSETDLDSSVHNGLLDQMVSMNNSVKNVLQSISIIKDVDQKMKNTVVVTINEAIKKYKQLIIDLKYYPEVVSQYIKGDLLDNTGFIKGMTTREVLSLVTNRLDDYSKEDSTENFKQLIQSIKLLVDLNKNLSFFLREILYETNPKGDYEHLIADYDF